jgi:hypothetical protein
MCNSSPDDYESRLLKNTAYLYLYALLEQGYIGKDFRSRFDEIERISRSGLCAKDSLFFKFFNTLGDEFEAVKAYRISSLSKSLSASVTSKLEQQMLIAIDHCLVREKFSIRPNLRFLKRIIEDSARNPNKAIVNFRLVSLRPRIKLLKSLQAVLQENFGKSDFQVDSAQKEMFYNCYEGNYL